MTTTCLFTSFAAPGGMALAKALLGAGHGLVLVEADGAAPSGAATHWTDTAAVLSTTNNADLVLYWVDAHGATPGCLAWMPRLAGVLCLDGASATGALAMAATHAAGIIATDAHPWLDASAGPVARIARDLPEQWLAALVSIGPQAMLALPLRAALRHFEATLDSWHGAPDLLATPALDAPLDVLRSGRRFL